MVAPGTNAISQGWGQNVPPSAAARRSMARARTCSLRRCARAARRKAANQAANKGRERKDLYTDAWDGSVYKGSSFNILSVLALLFVLTPLVGLAFAYLTYGELWG